MLGAALALVSAYGQGTFQNLDFEAAKLISTPLGYAATNALPGWSAFAGTNELSAIRGYGGAGILPVTLDASNSFVIGGTYDVVLGYASSLGEGSISQVGLVPLDAQTLFFKARVDPGSTLDVSLGSQGLLYSAIAAGSDYTLYGANISSFARETTTLTFAAAAGVGVLDDIQFSSQPIPEPPVLALLSLCGGLLTWTCARRRRLYLTRRMPGSVRGL